MAVDGNANEGQPGTSPAGVTVRSEVGLVLVTSALFSFLLTVTCCLTQKIDLTGVPTRYIYFLQRETYSTLPPPFFVGGEGTKAPTSFSHANTTRTAIGRHPQSPSEGLAYGRPELGGGVSSLGKFPGYLGRECHPDIPDNNLGAGLSEAKMGCVW